MVHHYLEDVPEEEVKVKSVIAPYPDTVPESHTPADTPPPTPPPPHPFKDVNISLPPLPPPLERCCAFPPMPPEPEVSQIALVLLGAFILGAASSGLICWSFSRKNAACPT